jgi:hypothetical protein
MLIGGTRGSAPDWRERRDIVRHRRQLIGWHRADKFSANKSGFENSFAAV